MKIVEEKSFIFLVSFRILLLFLNKTVILIYLVSPQVIS